MAEVGRIGLFDPIEIGSVVIPNRVVISPMQQYNGTRDGRPTAWHSLHLPRFAVGGAGMVVTEALAVLPEARLTWADLGLWEDGQIEPLARLVEAIEGFGAVACAQLNHAGRKGSVQRPWHGFNPLSAADGEARGETPWPTVSASAIEANPGWPVPQAIDADGIKRALDAFAASAARARKAGFRALNIHGAHGYLIHSFLSPLSNTREDDYGGSLENRMRFALEVADAVRSEWPADLPLIYRLSCVDDNEGGTQIEDSVALAKAFLKHGVDVVDCSSGGLQRRTTTMVVPRYEGYQVPYAEQIKREAGIKTMAVGLIRDPHYANSVVAEGRADFVAIGREALFNPHWPAQAAVALGGPEAFEDWPPAYGWWLRVRSRTLEVSTAAKG